MGACETGPLTAQKSRTMQMVRLTFLPRGGALAASCTERLVQRAEIYSARRNLGFPPPKPAQKVPRGRSADLQSALGSWRDKDERKSIRRLQPALWGQYQDAPLRKKLTENLFTSC